MIKNQQLLKKSSIFIACLSLGFFQAVIFVANSCAQPAMPTAQAGGQQPIDIQANEQDFADDQVIARGNVKVTYKDSVITGPIATLFRDPQGQPQKAIFEGHPSLVQPDSKMNADTLVFEIANSKVIAQGHAHSEVVSEGKADTDVGPKTAPKKAAAVPTPAPTGNGKQPFQWPKQGDDNDKQAASTAGSSTTTTAAASSTSTPASSKSDKKTIDQSSATEKIITDSDYQEYDKQNGHFDANGHVHVVHGDIIVYADKLQLIYGTDSKPETALFNGHVSAFQDKNNTQSDMLTYYLSTKRMQATGNVRSKVIQQKPTDAKGGKKDSTTGKVIGANPTTNPGAANATPAVNGSTNHQVDDDTILVVSDTQDYSKESTKMTADGNVKVYYQDTVGVGPRAVLYKNSQGKAEKVVFIGRSQITQPGKRWIADKLTMAVATKRVLAEGNSKAYILQQNTDDKHQSSTQLASKPNSTSNTSSTKLSASKVETIK